MAFTLKDLAQGALALIGNLANQAEKILLEVENVDPSLAQNPIVEVVQAGINDANNVTNGYAVLAKNYEGDYADLAPFSENSIPGRVIVVRLDGPLGKQLNLS